MEAIPRVLLTGGTGFVGRHLWPELERAGYEVVGLTRDRKRAEQKWPGRQWIEGDVCEEESLVRALEGCRFAYYLVHGMGEGHGDFRKREVESAKRFSHAVERAGIERVVYLGGMEPAGTVSEHLRSRLEVGDALREGAHSTVELRSSMIIGHGSLSWLMVRDLAARLPFMLLPRWLKSRTEPVAIEDVMVALVRALTVNLGTPGRGSEWFDIPGPQVFSGREILEHTADAMELSHPHVLEVPVLSPWLSSHWVRFVTRAEWAVAREVVVGLKDDMLSHDDRFWQLIDHPQRLRFEAAARRALAAEREDGPIPGFWGGVEGWVARRFRSRSAV
jgi:uncharacterized protein YbjT (DUF2867 family)